MPTEGLVPFTPPIHKSSVLCTQPPAGHAPNKGSRYAKQIKGALKTAPCVRTSATRRPLLSTPPHHALAILTPHAHSLLPEAVASVSHLNLPWFQLKLRFCFGRPEIKPFVGVGVVGGLEHRRTKKGGCLLGSNHPWSSSSSSWVYIPSEALFL